jgi:hypothetical protein
MTYAEKLRHPRWQKMRLEVLERDKFTCQLCGDTETTLDVHHFCYHVSGDPWGVDDSCLTTYCRHCHEMVEKINWDKVSILKVRKIKISKELYQLFVYAIAEKHGKQIIVIENNEIKAFFSEKALSELVSFSTEINFIPKHNAEQIN